MNERYRSILYNFLGISFAVFLVLVLFIYAFTEAQAVVPVIGYLLSFIFVGSNFIVLRNFQDRTHNEFYKRFFISLGVRFVLVVIAFIMVLKTIKIHQIYFTVSFIISYIFHSVIEIISINSLLKTDN